MSFGVVALFTAVSAGTRTGAQSGGDKGVTAVAGPSWLNQLGLPFTETSLGRGSGSYGPPAASAGEPTAPLTLPVDQRIVLTGQDLYRYSCQACHGGRGSGAPPEIKSMLPLVAEGRAGRGDLYKRIHTGGTRMPARDHLTGPDIDLLYGYLNQLAGTRAGALRSNAS
jgi:cytochrome c5